MGPAAGATRSAHHLDGPEGHRQVVRQRPLPDPRHRHGARASSSRPGSTRTASSRRAGAGDEKEPRQRGPSRLHRRGEVRFSIVGSGRRGAAPFIEVRAGRDQTSPEPRSHGGGGPVHAPSADAATHVVSCGGPGYAANLDRLGGAAAHHAIRTPPACRSGSRWRSGRASTAGRDERRARGGGIREPRTSTRSTLPSLASDEPRGGVRVFTGADLPSKPGMSFS